jgi:hypothetical protein
MAEDETFASRRSWPAYAAFCDYFATGEGRTVIVAIGPTAEEARLLFEKKAPAFFARSIQTADLLASDRSSCAIAQWVPAGVIERVSSSQGPFSFFAIFHQNVS